MRWTRVALLLLFGSAIVRAEPPRLVVLVYDYAELDRDLIKNAFDDVSYLAEGAGVRLMGATAVGRTAKATWRRGNSWFGS